MRTLIFIIVCMLFNINIFAEKRVVITNKNEFNGVTEEISFEENENEQLVKFQIYYNDKNIVVKHDYYTTAKVSKSSGIEKQIVFYDENQNIIKYIMEYNDNYYKKHGVTKLIEYVTNGNITLLEYFEGTEKVDYLYDIETANKYPFYKISYLTTQMIDTSRNIEGEEFIDFSAKYIRMRSVVLCNGEIEPLDKTDKKILNYTSQHINWPDILSYYSSKMLIEEDGIKYTMYIQNGIEKLLPLDFETTIRYYAIGYNGKLYLTMVNIYVEPN